MGQALYRTYRSKKLSEVIGQEHITQALENALTKGFICHAYLLTGPRGVGKTSIARILAYEINNLPYNENGSHLDIIEIDAASNRRIDEIRDLRDKVHIAPTSAKFKVYIIDEVHMLTREAFNALLKTLEEPPAHAIFILATTEVHKLPETIISRTQRYTFRPVELQKVIGHLRTIATKEKIKIDDDALALIAAHGEGSFRDSISLLDQMRNIGRTVTATDIESVLGIAPADVIEQLVAALENRDAATTVQLVGMLRNQGATPSQIAKQTSEFLRERFIANQLGLPHNDVIALLTKLLDVPGSSNPQNLLEILFLDVALSGRPSGTVSAPTVTPAPAKPAPAAPKAAASQVAPVVAVAPAPKRARPSATEATSEDIPQPLEHKSLKSEYEGSSPVSPAKEEVRQPAASNRATVATQDSDSAATTETLDEAVWPKVLHTIKKKYNTLYSILSAAQPHFEPGVVTLEVGFGFHQKRLSDSTNKKIIGDTIQEITGQAFMITCVKGKGKPTSSTPALPPAEEGEIVHTIASSNPAAAAITTKPKDESGDDYYISQAEKSSNQPVDTVNDIFGGGEVL